MLSIGTLVIIGVLSYICLFFFDKICVLLIAMSRPRAVFKKITSKLPGKAEDINYGKTGHFHFAKNRTFSLCIDKNLQSLEILEKG